MDSALIRAWWSYRQGLDGRLLGRAPAEVLAATGWARSVGGVGPYLTLLARAGTSREATDAAVAGLEIHELPAARGCTYVVPAADFALALKVGQGFQDAGDMRAARALGVTDAEVDALGEAVLAALTAGPLTPEELRQATGGAARSLGPEGKKKGLTTTLPLALGRLQAAGEIRRVPTNGRLDQQRYRYARWPDNPLSASTLSAEEAYIQLARRFFTWIGPATLAELQAFLGLGVKAARAAAEPLGLAPLAAGDERLMLPEQRDELLAFSPPPEPRYVLVSSLDGIVLLRRDAAGLLAEEDRARSVLGERGQVVAGGLKDLPSHAILDRGRLVGLWEYDPSSGSIAWASFIGRNAALDRAVAATEEMVRTQLGDARSFSLDSAASRVPRIAALRAAAH